MAAAWDQVPTVGRAPLLAQFPPPPLVLPYVIFGGLLVVLALLTALAPETASRPAVRRPGALSVSRFPRMPAASSLPPRRLRPRVRGLRRFYFPRARFPHRHRA